MTQRVVFFVWCEETGYTRYRHMDEQSARAEAERLAQVHPGKEFWVLRSVGSCRHSAVRWIECEEPEIPF